MVNKTQIEIVEPCGESYAGTWAIPSEDKSGPMCWRSHYGEAKAMIEWPDTLLCRYCQKVFTREQIREQWLQPIYFTQADGTFNCGCLYIDTSGT